MSEIGNAWEMVPDDSGDYNRLLQYANKLNITEPPEASSYGTARFMEPYTPTPSQRLGAGVMDLLQGAGARRDFAYRLGKGAEGAFDLTPMAAGYEAGQGLGANDYVRAGLGGLGAMPGGNMFHLAPAMFVGPLARGVDRKGLKLAKEAEELRGKPVQAGQSPGLSRDAVYEGTGWYKGPEGKWRTEISDEGAVLKKTIHDKPQTVGDMLDHPELFAKYPHLANIPVEHVPVWQIGTNKGSYSPLGAPGDPFSPPHIALNGLFNAESQKGTLLHELQHAVQDYEGWSAGGNTHVAPPIYDIEDVKKIDIERNELQKAYNEAAKNPAFAGSDAEKEAKQKLKDLEENKQNAAKYEGYRRFYGEAEARTTGDHPDLPMELRQARYPYKGMSGVGADQFTYNGTETGWHNYPLHFSSPLEDVLNGKLTGRDEINGHDMSRARWLLEFQALGPKHAEWKELVDKLGRTKTPEASAAIQAKMDELRDTLGPKERAMLDHADSLPSRWDTYAWDNTRKQLEDIGKASTADVAGRLQYSPDLHHMMNRGFHEFDPSTQDTLAKVEWAIQHHGPEVLRPHVETQMSRYLSPEEWDKYAKMPSSVFVQGSLMDPAAKTFWKPNSAKIDMQNEVFDRVLKNHQRLINEARQHHAERLQKHFYLLPEEQ